MTRKADIKLIDRVQKMVGLSRGQRRILHDEITGRRLTFREILSEAREIKRRYPGK
jgi:hypothetical protein